MINRKGSLIRRLAQERRDKPEEGIAEGGVGLTLSLDGLIKDEMPALTAVPAAAPPPALETPTPPVEAAPAAQPPLAKTASLEQGTAGEKGTPAMAKGADKHHGPRLARVPGRQRRRHADVCVRHPGEAKRNAGARAWLTPEESEKLELLATAYQVSTSTLTREIIVEGLEAHADLIEKTRRFLDSLGKGRVGA